MSFNPGRLQIARQRNLLNKKDLAEDIGVHPVYITRWENGTVIPEPSNIDRLASALGYPEKFFHGETLDFPDDASFRSLTSMTAKMRNAALSAGSLAFVISDWLEAEFELPEVSVPSIVGQDPAMTAVLLRQDWQLGEEPILNMVHLLESKGCRVFSLAENTNKVNAYSLWRRHVPFVFLNTMLSGERSRFDAAHELGHLVMHQDGHMRGREAEDQANTFASAFLMPREDVLAHAFVNPSVNELIRLKSRWEVAVIALAYRLHKLSLISDWKYRDLCIQISQAGYRTREPNPIPFERSKLWKKLLTLLWREGKTKDHIAKKLYLPVHEVTDLLFAMTAEPPAKSDSDLKII